MEASVKGPLWFRGGLNSSLNSSPNRHGFTGCGGIDNPTCGPDCACQVAFDGDGGGVSGFACISSVLEQRSPDEMESVDLLLYASKLWGVTALPCCSMMDLNDEALLLGFLNLAARLASRAPTPTLLRVRGLDALPRLEDQDEWRRTSSSSSGSMNRALMMLLLLPRL
mmetsp:Transcript_11765/g.36764  ORF Transcript_11765/g.36764 Transcript_11765/m.36764 type:complete len:168 (-) Transcript_11765:1162-1665(-)